MKIAIIGGGLAGLACATRLTRANHEVVIYDKGRSPGGRLATRTIETARGPVCFDHGAQYFTARDPAFRAEVGRWERAGMVAPWPAAGAEAWVGVPGMNAPALALAAALQVRRDVRVEALRQERSGWHMMGEGVDVDPFEAVVVAVAAEQVRALVAPVDQDLAGLADIPSEPCWTVMAAFEEPVRCGDDILQRRGILDWAARNSAKPGRTGPEAWVMHATPTWSRAHLQHPVEDIGPALLAALAEATGTNLPKSIVVVAHRWRYARSGRLGRSALWNSERKVGLCGDWLLGPRVESAWLSGDASAEEICASATR